MADINTTQTLIPPSPAQVEPSPPLAASSSSSSSSDPPFRSKPLCRSSQEVLMHHYPCTSLESPCPLCRLGGFTVPIGYHKSRPNRDAPLADTSFAAAAMHAPCTLTNTLVDPPLVSNECKLLIGTCGDTRNSASFDLLLSGADVFRLGCTPMGESSLCKVPFRLDEIRLQRFSSLQINIPLVDNETGSRTTKSVYLTPSCVWKEWIDAMEDGDIIVADAGVKPVSHELVRSKKEIEFKKVVDAGPFDTNDVTVTAPEKAKQHQYKMKLTPIQHDAGTSKGVAFLSDSGLASLHATVAASADPTLELHFTRVDEIPILLLFGKA